LGACMAEVSSVNRPVFSRASVVSPGESEHPETHRATLVDQPAETLVCNRVLMHTPEPQHGMAQYVSTIAKALSKSGVPVVLFCPENFVRKEELRAAGVHIEYAAFRPVSSAGVAERIMRNISFAMRSAPRQFRVTRPGDIVHFQSILHLPLGFAFLFAAILARASIVLTVHDPTPHRWRLPRGLNWIERKMLEIAYRLSDKIIVHNSEGKDLMVRRFHIPETSVSVIPHGHYSGEVSQTAFPPSDCLRLLAFGSVRENKGLHLAIRATRIVNASSRMPVILTIAGRAHNAAEERYWEECKKLIVSRGGEIQLIEGHIADEEIAPLLARHHAVLLPYTEFHSESGVALLALSHSRPILATTTGGLGDLMQRGACGVPIMSASAEAVADAIAMAIDMGSERLQELGSRGYNFVRRTRSWESIARQTTAVYGSLAQRPRQSIASAC
jgi:glycogen(starch) synthase